MKRSIASLIAIMVACSSTPAFAMIGVQAVSPQASEGQTRAIILFHQRVQSQDLQFLKGFGANVRRQYGVLPGVAVTLPTSVLERLQSSRIAGVFPDTVVHIALDQSIPQITADQVHALGINGTGVKVCIVDTGVDDSHPSLPHLVAEWDFVNNDSDATDDHNHGTHVAGIVASHHATYGGVAPGASLMAAKVLDSGGSGYTSDVMAGIDWCVQNGADVINMSLGGGLFSGTCDGEAISQTANAAVDVGVTVVAASGNDRSTSRISSPACASKVIAVGAVDSTDTVASYSNGGAQLDVVAPGSSIRSTVRGGGFQDFSGTSMATPHTAGAAALLLQTDPTLTPDQVRSILRDTAKDLGPVGFDSRYGYGRINAYAAYSTALNGPPPTPGALFSEDFESGLNRWQNTGWNVQNPADTAVPGSASGNDVAHASNCDNECALSLTGAVDLSGYDNGRLTFKRYVDRSIDSGEYLAADLWNGSTWQNVRSWTNGSGDDGVWHTESIDLTPYAGGTVKLRFRGLMSSTLEDVQVDDILVTALGSQGDVEGGDNAAPQAAAGPDQLVHDSDGTGSEQVTLNGVGSTDSDGTIVSYAWKEGVQVLGTSVSITPSLSVGQHTITLTVTDDDGATGADTVVVTVLANAVPQVNAGSDKTVTDSDESGSELVTLIGSASDSDGTIVSVEWKEGAQVLGTSATLATSFSVGQHTVIFTAFDNGSASASDTVLVTVEDGAAPPPPPPPPPSGPLFSEDFESGLSAWQNGGWTLQAPEDAAVPGAPSGNDIAHAEDCDNECALTLAGTIDLSGLSNAFLSFDRYVDHGLDRDEYLAVDLWNGNTWQTVLYWTHRFGDDDTWHHEIVDLSSYLGGILKIRFRGKMSSRLEFVEVDSVVVTGS